MSDYERAPLYEDIAMAPPGSRSIWRTASDGIRLRTAVWPGGSKGTILILQGRAEYIEKYGPTVARLKSAGYAVVTCDWRGQGLSERLSEDQNLGHVERFSDYQQDLQEMLDVAREMGLPEPRHILAHSMGGTIALHALLAGLKVRKVVLSAPFWDIHTSAGLKAYAHLVSTLAPAIGFGSSRTPTTLPNSYVSLAPFEDNLLTSDRETYAWMQEHLMAHPELALGGPSLHWLREALSEMRFLDQIESPLPDCLCFLGSEEKMVSPKAIHRVMGHWANSKLVIVPGARHEVLMEKPDILSGVWEKILDFLTE